MRAINQIIIAVQECAAATDEELRMCVAALNGLEYSTNRKLEKLVEAVDEGRPVSIGIWANEARRWPETRFAVFKKSPLDWLGPNNTPGTPENNAQRRNSKAICKAATGIDLASGNDNEAPRGAGGVE